MSETARKNGLLYLEEECDKLDKNDPSQNFLMRLITLVVDGTEDGIIRRMAYSMFYVDDLKGFEALENTISIERMLKIQAGINPRVLEEEIISMMPRDLRIRYRQQDGYRDIIDPYEISADMNTVKKLCEYEEGEDSYGSDEDYVYNIIVYALNELDDLAMQRLISETNSFDLSTAMKGMNGKTRARIFGNVSERVAIMMADEMEYMGPVRMLDVEKALNNIFINLVKLIRTGEIVCPGSEVIEVFGKIFDYEVMEPQKEIKDLKKDLLKKVTEGYLGTKLIN